MKPRAAAYLRTSSAANVNGDSAHRQNAAIMQYGARAGVEVVACFYDAAVSGADQVGTRKGFAAMMAFCEEYGITSIVVETANRFSRDLIVQETGHAMLTAKGFALIAADDPDGFTNDTPTAVLIRQILGAVAQFDKAMTVDKLRAARDRASAAKGRRVEGRKGHLERDPALAKEARRLARKSPRTGEARSLRQSLDRQRDFTSGTGGGRRCCRRAAGFGCAATGGHSQHSGSKAEQAQKCSPGLLLGHWFFSCFDFENVTAIVV